MRKVTQQAAAAFHGSRKFKSGATQVNPRLGGVELVLHGSVIAREIDGGGLSVNLCGYPTKVTRERLNSLHGVSISQDKGIQYLNGEVMPENGWVKIS